MNPSFEPQPVEEPNWAWVLDDIGIHVENRLHLKPFSKGVFLTEKAELLVVWSVSRFEIDGASLGGTGSFDPISLGAKLFKSTRLATIRAALKSKQILTALNRIGATLGDAAG